MYLYNIVLYLEKDISLLYISLKIEELSYEYTLKQNSYFNKNSSMSKIKIEFNWKVDKNIEVVVGSWQVENVSSHLLQWKFTLTARESKFSIIE